MNTDCVTPKDEFESMKHVGEVLTNEKIIDGLVAQATDKYCPSVNGNCLGHKCTMFVVDRPRADRRYLEARCTHAGKRPLAFHYGLPKDFKDYECFYGLEEEDR